MNITNKQQFRVHSPSHYVQNNAFNDYRLYSCTPSTLQHQRASSTTSIYFHNNNNNLSRKKLTVISKENQSHEFVNDYNIPKNIQQSQKNCRALYSQNNQNLNSYNNSLNNSQVAQPISRFKISRNKFQKRQGHNTPTKGLNLKKSLLNSQRKKEYLTKSQDKRQYYSNTQSKSLSKILKLGRKNDQNERENQFAIFKNQIQQRLEFLIKQVQKKNHQQVNLIKNLESKLRNNQQKIKEKDQLIQELVKKANCKINKNSNSVFLQVNPQQNNYLLTKIKDTQIKLSLLLKSQLKLQQSQNSINQKLQIFSKQLIKITNFKLQKLRYNVSNFLCQKTKEIVNLSECINCLEYKLIGKTQALKETIVQLKLKVKQIEDTWTKDTNKSQIHIQKDQAFQQNQTQVSGSKNIRYYEKKIKYFTNKNYQQRDKNNLEFNNKQKPSNYSFISISQKYNTEEQKQFIENLIQIQNQQIATDQEKDETFISDCFFYPNSNSQINSKSISRSHSPINNQKAVQNQKNMDRFFWIDQNQKQKSQQSSDILPAFNFPEKQKYQINSLTVNKKIQVIQELLTQKKKKTGNTQPLRCFLDGSGYLKYFDSRTFVFDKKGNLIPLTGGQLYILVMKKLIQCTN